MDDLKQLCIDLEHFETPQWAAEAILRHEILTHYVFDPCVGGGALTDAAKAEGHDVLSLDIHDWGFPGTVVGDFLEWHQIINGDISSRTIFMNPPFSKACEFVEKSFALGVRKIVCFQRFAWWESVKRRDFWQKNLPNRIYICGSRADCWRHDIPKENRTSSTPTAHAWFVWERGNPSGTLVGHIRKDGGNG